jgi:hypothetical protein
MYVRVPQETWEAPTPPPRGGTAERSASEPSGGAGESECRSRSEDAGEPTRGTLRSKGRHRVTEPLEGKMRETPSSTTISTKLKRIAKQAREAPTIFVIRPTIFVIRPSTGAFHRPTDHDRNPAPSSPAVDGTAELHLTVLEACRTEDTLPHDAVRDAGDRAAAPRAHAPRYPP